MALKTSSMDRWLKALYSHEATLIKWPPPGTPPGHRRGTVRWRRWRLQHQPWRSALSVMVNDETFVFTPLRLPAYNPDTPLMRIVRKHEALQAKIRSGLDDAGKTRVWVPIPIKGE